MRKLIAIFSMSVLTACAGQPVKKPDHMELTKTSFSEIDGWSSDRHLDAIEPFKRSCQKILSKQPEDMVGPSPEFGLVSEWAEGCKMLESMQISSNEQARIYFENNFVPYIVTNNGDPKGLVTGYYEIDVRASKTKTKEYFYPIYSLPADLSEPYFSREQIDKGALENRGLEIAWAADPVDVFFMHIQGSGKLIFPDGSSKGVGYAGKNGHPYYAIGRALIEAGDLTKENVSAPAIMEWLRKNKDKSFELMWKNQSYVFFRELRSDPVGAQGVPVTPMRSIAIDKNFIAYGTPVFLVTNSPQTPNYQFEEIKRLFIAQDTGGAIKGPTRVDLFWGSGSMAAEKAGYMKQEGRMYLFLPKTLDLKPQFALN